MGATVEDRPAATAQVPIKGPMSPINGPEVLFDAIPDASKCAFQCLSVLEVPIFTQALPADSRQCNVSLRFQDRRIRPLCHPSEAMMMGVFTHHGQR